MNRRGRKETQHQPRLPAPPAVFVCIGLVVLVAAIYAQTAGFDYVTFDDDLYASRNPVVHAGLTSAGTLNVVPVMKSIHAIPASAAGSAAMMIAESIHDWKLTTMRR